MTKEDEHLQRIEQIFDEIKMHSKGWKREQIQHALAVSTWLNELLKDEIPKERLKALRQGKMSMLLEQWHIIKRDEKRQAGTRKEKRPKITSWIEKRLKYNPHEKSPDMWSDAPDFITDQISYHRFSKRVTGVRKKIKSAASN
jgi:hypothetical protein